MAVAALGHILEVDPSAWWGRAKKNRFRKASKKRFGDASDLNDAE